ncbi:MAG TPA: hypothetical protein VGC36_00545 [Rhizomicrobium sp.]
MGAASPRYRLDAESDDDPAALLRIVTPLLVAGAVLESVAMTRVAAGGYTLTVAFDGLPRERARHVAERIRQMPLMRRCDLAARD